MVYIDPGDLKWRPYVRTWLDSKFPAKLADATKASYSILACMVLFICTFASASTCIYMCGVLLLRICTNCSIAGLHHGAV